MISNEPLARKTLTLQTVCSINGVAQTGIDDERRTTMARKTITRRQLDHWRTLTGEDTNYLYELALDIRNIRAHGATSKEAAARVANRLPEESRYGKAPEQFVGFLERLAELEFELSRAQEDALLATGDYGISMSYYTTWKVKDGAFTTVNPSTIDALVSYGMVVFVPGDGLGKLRGIKLTNLGHAYYDELKSRPRPQDEAPDMGPLWTVSFYGGKLRFEEYKVVKELPNTLEIIPVSPYGTPSVRRARVLKNDIGTRTYFATKADAYLAILTRYQGRVSQAERELTAAKANLSDLVDCGSKMGLRTDENETETKGR
jgi:hypothetical protein